MERDGDLLLNVSCSAKGFPEYGRKKLPARMPDGTKLENSVKFTRKITKTHQPATTSGAVFIPKHKLPVLDEFGLSIPSDNVGYVKPPRMLPSLAERENNHEPPRKQPPEEDKGETQSPGQLKRRKRKKRDEELKIIPKEVQAVAGGLPPSFPKHRIKKFTEEYQLKKRKQLDENGDDQKQSKKRRSFVPGLNPCKREKAASLFTKTELGDLHDLHPYLVSNLEQNFDIKTLTKVQSLAIPQLLATRFEATAKHRHFIINSGIGTGKILSYVIPIVNNLALMEPKIDRTAGIYALILLPTRELAAQVNDIFTKLCRSFLWVVPGLLTGGERKKSEKARLRKGLNILITTPGRLIDHMEHSRSMNFNKMKYCVLADAHRLLDPERAEVAKQIAIVLRKRLPADCIRCVVTATLTKKLEKLIEIILANPHTIDAFREFE